MQNFIREIKEHAIDYGSIPFWSWNDRLEEKELRRQINVMHDLGMKGFFMHARGGLETEYLSEEWYDCIRACVDEAEKLDMEAWSYDENGWPSGFAGGKLLTDPANWATYLKCETSPTFPTDEHLLAAYVIEGGRCRRVTAPEDGVKEYTAIIQAWDNSYVDTMDAEIITKFVETIHAEYEEKVGFSRHMPGFFTDEPQYYRWATPWSNKMPGEFKERYGYDVLDGLAALFVDYEGSEEFCWDYYRLCHELFINGYVKVIYDWCEEHGCKLTGHAVEEANLHGQMWCCGGVMPFYEYEHIPGIDYLCRNIDTDIAPRQLGSACEQLGKKQAISEMFGACGWDVTPRELKRIAELQYANGVNMMCQHLYSYSMRGQRKRDWPCHYSEHLPWQKAMGEFNNYFNHLGYVVSRGKEAARVLVIHPVHSAYLNYKRETDYESIKKLQDDLVALNALLSEHQIPYHFGDECMMAKMGSVEQDRIRVGLCTYDYVVIPSMDTLDRTTAEMLKRYMENGGKVYLFGKVPTRIDGRKAELGWLAANCTFEQLRETADLVIEAAGKNVPQLRQMARCTEYGRIFFITNITGEQIDQVQLRVRSCRGLYALDLHTLEYTPVSGKADASGCFTTKLDFEDSGSYVLVEMPADCEALADFSADCRAETKKAEADVISADSHKSAVDLSDSSFTLTKPLDNMMTLDYAEISYDGVHYEKSRPVILLKDLLLRNRFRGDIWLRYSFDVEEMPQSLYVAAEPLTYKSLVINGNPFALDGDWWFDRKFVTADIAPFIQIGHNEIVMQISYFQRDYVYYVMYGGVSESLRNCLNFDTEIEFIYLFGNFCVKTDNSLMTAVENNAYCYTGDFKIVAQKKEIDLSNVVTDGYPFFAGEIEAQTVYNWKAGDAAELYIRGRYAVCDVSVNEAFAGRVLFKQHIDLSELLKEGENTITLKLYNSNRNLLGPHHHIIPEPLGVAPSVLSLESMWENEQCPEFVDRYSFVRFGIDC